MRGLIVIIKEVSELFQISADTLRYYERVAVLPEVTRNANGIWEYQPIDLEWIQMMSSFSMAGVLIEMLVEYRHLFQLEDSMLNSRGDLLKEAREKIFNWEETLRGSIREIEL